jgi:hypothetical protein
MHDMGRVVQDDRAGRWRGMAWDLKPHIYPLACRLIPAVDGSFCRAVPKYLGCLHTAGTGLTARQCNSLACVSISTVVGSNGD